MEKEYTYSVARIKAKEISLLSKNDVNTLLSFRFVEDCIRFLRDKGWAECKNNDFETMIYEEENTLWTLIDELVGENKDFDVFRCMNDFHNIKAAVKLVVRNKDNVERFFLDKGTVSAEKIYKAVKDNDFDSLPIHLAECAKSAFHTLAQTGDGQLCDMFIDKKFLEYLFELTSNSKCELVRDYGELTVAAADIKIAVRCLKTGKKLDFIKQALAPCKTLNIDMLAESAAKSLNDIYNYLSYTDYSNAVNYLKKSPSEFEKYFDNILMDKIKWQKSNSFSIAPIIAYFLARQNEIKTVRIILSGKQNGLDENNIKNRLRDMYV